MNTDDTPSEAAICETDTPGSAPSDIADPESIAKLVKRFKEGKKQMEYIRPEMMPDIDLYMDQATTFMDSHLQSTKRYLEDKILTKTMINNYAKNNLLPPPFKKKYSKDHLLLLTFIYYLKNMLSMNDIQSLLEPIKAEFFQNRQSPLHLEDIYREIFTQASDIQDDILADISAKFNQSRDSFSRFSFNSDTASPSGPRETSLTEETRDMLQDFTFVCLLCYDIFLKKQLVEQIIDTMGQKEKIPKDSKKHKS